jgi:exosome complex exonuclease DIS3/RRP44
VTRGGWTDAVVRYLVQKRLDMLPQLLTETLCSLTGLNEHFAFSVIWEMTPEAEIVNVDFCKSIIYSIAALSYGEAQMIMDDPNQTDAKAQGIRDLNSLAKKLRNKRMEAGALLLASAEVRFVLDSESHNPTDVQMYQLKETNALVEEFMLLANITVGKKILRHFPTLAVLRRHPAPVKTQFESLMAAAATRGLSLNVDTSRSLQDSLDAAVDPADPYVNKVIRILCTRCMSPAQYFCSGEVAQEDWHHYGLAAPIYTHFTSPIRRYADVVVHRLLAACIGVAPLPQSLADKGNLHELCENMNRRHRAAQMAGRGSVAFHTVLYFREMPTTEDAYVLRILRGGLIVLVPRFGIEGRVSLRHLEESGLIKADTERHELAYRGRGGDGPCTIRVFDKVRVHIRVQGSGTQRDAVIYTLESPRLGDDAAPRPGAAGQEAKKRKTGR